MSILSILLVILVITAVTTHSKALKIINQPLNIIAVEGSFAWLNCGVIGREKPITITWYHNGRVFRMLNSNRVTITDNGQVNFFRIRASDVGTYYCIASNKFESVVSRNATIRISSYKPVLKNTFEEIPKGGYYDWNETVFLYCKPPYGRPKPLVRWYKNGEKIQPKGERLKIDNYGTLIIHSFEAQDEGYYYCEARNFAGSRRSPEIVVALFVPLSFVQKPVDVTARIGSVTTFYCFAEGSPAPTISWQKEDVILSAGQTSGRMRVLEDGTLEIFDVQILDKGKYTCIVDNKINKHRSSAMLHVLYAPTIASTSDNETAYENNKITLRCKVDGFPMPTVSWFTEDGVQPGDIEVTKHGNEHLLTITNIKDVHEGKYICEAKNKLGVARKDLFLNVGGWSCSSTQFMCGKGHCIPKVWICDLDNDCGDNIDEENCVDIKLCSSLHDFSCSNGRCIPWSMTCDGDNDCGDGSDEHQDSCFHKCNSSVFFTCRNWKCIPKFWRCDNYDDCKDGSDEIGCTGSSLSCSSDEFQCVKDKGKKCIPKAWKCDKEKDCSDSSDEMNCEYTGCGPGSSTFPCHNGDCIPFPWKCDGEFDCRDGSDELSCDKVQTIPTKCNKEDHLCDGVWCVSSSWVCDGDRDCRDGSDERNCGLPPISPSRCRQDQYECDGICILSNQVCDGSYNCPDRSDETMCQEYILYSKQDSINKLDLQNLPSKVLISSLQNAVAIDIDLSEGRIYWTDIVHDNIKRAMLNGPNNRTIETVIQFNLESPEGIAIDWIGRKMYWTDRLPGKIEVAELDGRNRAVLMSENVNRPRAIVVHPKKRYLFWTEWGEDAQIEKCGMNGDPETRQILVEKNIEWPNGLAIDYQTERIWWVDAAKRASIESINLDGTNRKTIISSNDGTLGHPFSLAVFGESIFWTDWSQKLIYRSTKKNPNDKIIVERIPGDLSPMDIKVVHPHQQEKELNPCDVNNGQCSHLCLLSPNKKQPFSCFCSTGLRLGKDKKTCTIEDNQPYILFANRVGIFYSDISLKQVSPVLAGIAGGAAALDVDIKNKYMYWSNVVNDTIERVSFSHIGAVETIINTNLKLVDGIAFDWVNKKLYWTDGSRRVIEVTDPEETNLRLTLVKTGLDKPRAIVLHPKTRYMYWSDWGADNPKIERCGMNGDLTTRETIVGKDIAFPNGLAIDYVEDKIWWADAMLDKIETANLDGTMRRAVVKEPSIHPFSLVVYNSSILWTDWVDNDIFKADKLAGKIFFSKDVGIFRPTGIRVVHEELYHPEPNPCGRKKKGRCSQLCLLAPKPPFYSCHCRNGMTLLSDGKSCR